ncbi:type II secretion system F family protein [Verrucomicrobiota bacterium]
MPAFVYTARNRSGEKVEDSVEAGDRRSALAQIERLGLVPVSVVEGSSVHAESAAKKRFIVWHGRQARMGTRDVLLFTTELNDLLSSGMTLGNALNCLAKRKTGKSSDQILADLRDQIVRGASLSEAMSKHPATFTKLYVSMIQAGEASGALSEVLKRLVEHYERIQETKEKIIMALVYPVIVLVIGAISMLVLMLRVIPQFEKIFSEINETLPLPTRILMASSSGMLKYGWILLAAVIFLVVMAKRAIKTEHGRLWWDRFRLRIPFVKGVIASGVYANFSRTLATLLANGVSVLDALTIVEQTVDNTVIGKEIRNAKQRVTDGTSISGPLAAGKMFPTIMTDMLAVGEQTGDMSSALVHIARRYENELDRNLKIFTTVLEPIMIVFMALIVGFIAVSIIMAVFKLTSGLGAG